MISKCENYCCEDVSLIENYDKAINDKNIIWHCHHRLETHYEDGSRRIEGDLLAKDLIDANKYYNVPARELIYLLPLEHHQLHAEKQSERLTEESHKLMSEKAKNRHIPRTKEWNEKISKSHLGRKLSESHKEALRKNHVGMTGKKMPGFRWYTNGIDNIRTREECPEGYWRGRTC